MRVDAGRTATTNTEPRARRIPYAVLCTPYSVPRSRPMPITNPQLDRATISILLPLRARRIADRKNLKGTGDSRVTIPHQKPCILRPLRPNIVTRSGDVFITKNIFATYHRSHPQPHAHSAICTLHSSLCNRLSPPIHPHPLHRLLERAKVAPLSRAVRPLTADHQQTIPTTKPLFLRSPAKTLSPQKLRDNDHQRAKLWAEQHYCAVHHAALSMLHSAFCILHFAFCILTSPLPTYFSMMPLKL
jgi:hypothetical protein